MCGLFEIKSVLIIRIKINKITSIDPTEKYTLFPLFPGSAFINFNSSRISFRSLLDIS